MFSKNRGILPNSFYEVSKTPMPAPAKDNTRNCSPVFFMNVEISSTVHYQSRPRFIHRDQAGFVHNGRHGMTSETQCK